MTSLSHLTAEELAAMLLSSAISLERGFPAHADLLRECGARLRRKVQRGMLEKVIKDQMFGDNFHRAGLADAILALLYPAATTAQGADNRKE